PCYRSEHTIEIVVEEIDTLMQSHTDYRYEIVLVNDYSPDNVWEKIVNLAEKRENIKAVSFAKNFGQHAALMAGYRVAEGDIVVSLDDDGQTPVDETFVLIDKLNEGYDVVYARYHQLKESLWRRCGSWLSNKMSEVLIGKPKEILGSSFYAMKNFVAKEMVKYKNSYPFVGGLVFRSTKSIANVYVNHRDRLEGTSGYSFLKLFKLWMNGFTAFSVIPLRASSLIGVICAILGFIFGIVTIVRKLLYPGISIGWSSTVSIMLFMGGLIMLMLGMIGEYIGRIYISLNNSPQYVIKETVNLETTNPKDNT
ncbi:MAG: glycosyltransferase family 2 protein, partial [Clostridia bacterium]|nr:glycosyltransferase family 2 protein [Clostridia bacterium]